MACSSWISTVIKYSAHYREFVRPRVIIALRHQSSLPFSVTKKLKPFAAIPGPNGTLSNLYEYATRGVPKLTELVRERFARYGPIYAEQMFSRTLVNISDVAGIENVLRTSTFPMRGGLDVADLINQELNYPASGIASNKYQMWFQERAILSQKMLKTKEVNRAFPGLNAVARDVAARFNCIKLADGTVENLDNELFHWAVESISTFFFNERLGFYDDPPKPGAVEFVGAARDLTYYAGKIIFGPPFYRYFNTPTYVGLKKSIEVIYGVGLDIVCKTAVMKQEQGKSKTSLFEQLAMTNKLSPELIVNILVALSAAGVETSGSTAQWLLYQLSRHPVKQEKLYQELKSVLGTDGEISRENIGRLSYLKSCLKESLRVIPSVFVVPRKFDHDIEVMGYHVPAGVDIMLYTLMTNKNEQYYGENAKEFLPERWLRDEFGNKIKYNAFTNLPFGHGIRMCIGRRIFEAEVYTLISQLMLKFRFEYGAPGKLMPIVNGVVVKPHKPLLVKFIPR